MADTLTPEKRSAQMSRIRAGNTKIELLVRRGLHSRGFRYCLGGRNLPGRPDIVLPKYKAAVFVHGCFWHGHACPLYRLPKTRTEFWRAKVEANRARDQRVRALIFESGWRIFEVWECSLRNAPEFAQNEVFNSLARRIVDDGQVMSDRQGTSR